MYRELSRWGLAFVIIVALLVRVGFVAFFWNEIQPEGKLKDPDDYGRLALNFVKTGTFGFPIEANGQAESQSQSQAQSQSQSREISTVQSAAKSSSTRMRPTAYRPPLYPAFLTPAVIPDLVHGVPLQQAELNAFVVVGIHIFLGLMTVAMVYYIAWRLDYRWGWVPALAVAADPILLHFSGEMMTETLVTFIAVWAWALYLILVRPDLSEIGRVAWGMRMSLRTSLLLGFVLGLAVLTRPTMLPWAVLMVASLSLRGTEAGNRVSMITAALIVMTLVNVGWMVRNKQQLGQPIWTTTHGGYTLLLANNPHLYQHFKSNGPDRNWDSDSFHKLWAKRRSEDPRNLDFWKAEVPEGIVHEPDIDELKDDKLAQETAIATIKADPETFVKSCLFRAGWLWTIYPNVDEDQERERLIIGIWYGIWFTMAVLGMLWLREALTSRVWLMPILLVLTLTAIHVIYWSNMRMRAPMMPVVYMLACWPLMRARTPSRL